LINFSKNQSTKILLSFHSHFKFSNIFFGKGIDRHYQIYGTLFGASFPDSSPGGSFNAGWLLQRCKPSSKDTSGYLTSLGGGVTGYFPPPYPFGVGLGISSGGAAVSLGAGFPPGVSGSFGFGHRLYP